MEKMNAYRLMDWGKGGYDEVPVPAPGPGDALVKIGGAGLCGSDLHFLDLPEGGWASPPPFTLGHENAGWIVELGPGASEFAVGDAVIATGICSCGRCRHCVAGHDNLCQNAMAGRGAGIDGGLAQFLVVPRRELVPLGGLEPRVAAPLADAGHTSYGAVNYVKDRLPPDATALVIGAGGVGSYALQYLKLLTSARVVAIDISESRRALASEFGADAVLAPGPDTVEQIRELTGGRGADAVIDFVGSTETVNLALDSAAVAGRVALVGLGQAEVTFAWGVRPPIACEVSWRMGSSLGDLRSVISLAERGLLRIDCDYFGFDEIDHALDLLRQGKLAGRAVVEPTR